MVTPLTSRGTGRRKRSVCRVQLRKGTGEIIVNAKPIFEFLQSRKTLELKATRPLAVTNTTNDFDVYVRAFGGGSTGTAGAISLGIARALIETNPDFRPVLKKEGLLTRDPREKERKKYGLHRARKARQYRKR